jgi:O-acetyl-ADP-ribose deacetylase (regulator of RNase III)
LIFEPVLDVPSPAHFSMIAGASSLDAAPGAIALTKSQLQRPPSTIQPKSAPKTRANAPNSPIRKNRRSPAPHPRLYEIDGDLFDDAPPSATLAHCVGADFAMGAGVAVEFRKRFGEQQLLRDLHLRPGQIATRPQRDNKGRIERFIMHLVTKPRSANCLPRPREFRGAVRSCAMECKRLGIDTLAIPQIGAGLDRQPWRWAKRVILQEFSALTVDIDILVFLKPGEGPRRKPWPKKRPASQTAPADSKKSPTSRFTDDLAKKEASAKNSTNPTSAPDIANAASPKAPAASTTQSTPKASLSLAEGGNATVDAPLTQPPIETTQPGEPSSTQPPTPARESARPGKPPPEPTQMKLRNSQKNTTGKPKDKGK